MNTESKIREKTRGRFFVTNIIGTSPKILEVIRLIEKVADSPLGVLITGESGTGKELVGRTIHYSSSRFGKPFIDINCAALPESLLESELFGIEKGVATGVERRIGKIEMANGGTLFLDEIGDMSLPAQAKLLRVLQEKKLEKVGGRNAIEVDVRVLAATNKDLKEEIKKGSFREDLYYRLNVIHIHMPPLREMKEDIPLLAQYFLSSFASELGRGSMHFSSGAMECLVNYSWPGNVRELENEVKRAAVLANDDVDDVIEENHLSENVRSVAQSLESARTTNTLKEAVEEFEIRLIKETLEKNSGNKQKTAKILGLTKQGLIKKLKKYEQKTLASKSIEMDKQPGKQKGSHVRHIEIVPPSTDLSGGSLQAKHKAPEAVQPFDPSISFDKTQDRPLDSAQDRLRQSKELRTQGSRQPERRHLTVMFCDLVGFTALSEQVDPEDLHEIIRTYLDICSKVISRFDGHIAKYLGDGLLVYFGYPSSHEDDALRAVRTGLEIVGTISSADSARSSTRTIHELPLRNRRLQIPLQVRVGIHTGLVVIGAMGVENVPESMDIVGETPNIAARLLSIAEPNTVVISSATYRLVEGLFEYNYLGLHTLKGFSAPLDVYRVLHESGIQSRFEVAITKGLTPLVGRDQEGGLLLERWERVKDGEGQVVLLCGEPGIGKSRLVQVLKERLAGEAHVRMESRCSPYYQNSALYPVIDHLQRLLFKREDSPEEKLKKLERVLEQHGFSLKETVPLFASLLSLPLPDRYPPLNLTPQRQKQKTLEALLAWLLKEAEKQPVVRIVEDLHWVDSSTLEYLSLLVEQVPTARIFTLLTFRPDFSPPWASRSHLTQITLSRLARKEVETMIERVVGGKALPAQVLQELVAKTDGIPLFVEELTKMVLGSGLLKERENQYELIGPLFTLAIPTTLQDSLMARLDRLGNAKEVAQLGAMFGREFTYELLQAVSPLDEAILQRELSRLVEAELLYQRDFPPQAKYFFKHALIQEAAYQSLLKSKRHQYHQRIAQVLGKRFPETVETQPELLAHHYTEAGLIKQAIPYWQWAGERAIKRSANVEAIGHLTKGLELVKTIPDTPERTQQELDLQSTLGPALIATKGYGAVEVEKAYTRARELCRQLGETPQLFRVLWVLWAFYAGRAELKTEHELAEQLMHLAQSVRDPELLLEAHLALGVALFWFGEFAQAHEQLEQVITLYDPQKHRSHAFIYGQDPGVFCLSYAARTLWYLGYPDQALKKSRESIILAEKTTHPFTLAFALYWAAVFCQLCRDRQMTQERIEAAITLCTEQGFTLWLAGGTILRGWALADQRKGENGITQMHQGLAAWRATGIEIARPYFLALMAEVYGEVGQAGEGFAMLAEALAAVYKGGERLYEAELYRLKGELLQNVERGMLNAESIHQSAIRNLQSEAEECFRQALEVARYQKAKSLELRAVMSLSRLLQRQGKKEEARQMLAEIYGWFTEGFETADLKEAKLLLEELS